MRIPCVTPAILHGTLIYIYSSFDLAGLKKFFHARQSAYHTDARMIDNAIYTPYRYDEAPTSSKRNDPPLGTLVDIEEPRSSRRKGKSKFLVPPDHLADIFVFVYGVIVIWGMTEPQEKRFLSSMYVHCLRKSLMRCVANQFRRKRFEVDRLSQNDIEMEDLNYYYANYSR